MTNVRQYQPTPAGRSVASDWILSRSKWIHVHCLVAPIPSRNHENFCPGYGARFALSWWQQETAHRVMVGDSQEGCHGDSNSGG
jgi:hypothetical protein